MSAYQSIFRPGLFGDELHLVTGGGSGIGRCVAHELAALGARLVLIGRHADKLTRVAAEIAEDGGRAETCSLDIRDEAQVKEVIAAIVAKHGRIHGLVNNAGGQFPSPLEAISKKGFDAVVATNLTGGFLMAREVYLQSMQRHGGAMVNMAADMWKGMPGMGHSGAARAGMVNLTMTAAVEWAHSNVRVNAVAPGWIASSGFDTYPEPMRELLRSLRAHVPLGRLGLEAEVSSAICFLLSPAAAFITGITLPIDGGAPLDSPLFPIAERPASSSYAGFHRAVIPEALREEER